jgi:hypothetical protein
MLLVDLTYIEYGTKMGISKIGTSLLLGESCWTVIAMMLTFADFAVCLCTE